MHGFLEPGCDEHKSMIAVLIYIKLFHTWAVFMINSLTLAPITCVYYLLLLFNPLVPPPSANLTSNVVLAGSPATLQCTVMLNSSLTCSGPVTVMVNLISTSPSNSVIDTQTATGSGSTCTVSLSVSPMVNGTSGGQYNCCVQLNYTATNSAFVTPPGQIDSDPATLYVVGE